MKNKKEIITPFVADEPFYDFREKKWFRNDFFAGISKQFTPEFGADFIICIKILISARFDKQTVSA